jgi:hypothetical protein
MVVFGDAANLLEMEVQLLFKRNLGVLTDIEPAAFLWSFV